MSAIKKTKGEVLFDIINYFLMGLVAFSTLYPFLNVLTMSLCYPAEANSAGLHLFPRTPTLEAYRMLLENQYIWNGYLNTIIRTVSGTAVNVILSAMTAYALSKKYFPNRNFWTLFIVFTMFFGGGLIPSYLLIQKLGLVNTRLVLILPSAISAFNMIIVRNYFMTLPVELEESAKLDGANDIRILISVIIPLSMPIIATISLWYAVGHWNAWFDALIYITDQKLMVLQVLLRKMVIEGSSQYMESSGTGVMDSSYIPTPETLKAATIMVSSIPIIMVYPFIQKYFMKGIMIGSLKG